MYRINGIIYAYYIDIVSKYNNKSDEKESTFIVDSQRNLPQAERG